MPSSAPETATPASGPTLLPGLCTAALALPWLNPFADGPSPTVTPTLIAAACTGCVLLLARPASLARPVLLFALALGAALALASGGLTPEALASWLALAMIASCAAVGAEAARQPGLIRCMAWAWLVAALLSCAMALVQYAGLASYFHPWISQSSDGTPFANLRQRNQLATLTGFGLVALLWLLSRRPDPGPGQRVLAGLSLQALWMAPLLAVVLAITGSRAGLAQLAALAACAWLWRDSMARQARRLVRLAVPVYCLAAVLLPWLKGAGIGGAFARAAAGELGCATRRVLWSNVLELIGQRPWTGWGWRELAWAHYQGGTQGHFAERFCQIPDNAHSLPLHLAVELGLPCALLVLLALAAAVWRLQPWRERDATRQMAWGILLLTAIHSLVEYPLWYGPFQMAAGLAAGLLLAGGQKPGEISISEAFSRKVRAIWCFVAIVLVASSVWSAREYRRISQIYLPVEARDPAFQGDTLRKIGSSWLFGNQLDFARLSITPLSQANAAQQRALAQRLLHYSPEPRVIEVLIESASLMGDLDAAVAELQRYRAAFPEDYVDWSQRNARAAGGVPAQ